MEIDDKNLIERIYLFGCIGQIVIVSGIVYFVRKRPKYVFCTLALLGAV